MAGEVAAAGGLDGTVLPEATGDPSMFLLPPLEQLRASYQFLTPGTYALDYMTLIAPPSVLQGLTLDGLPVELRGEGVQAETVLGSRDILLHIPIEDGAHSIEAQAPFGLIVYAYDRFVSYAYPGGLNLTKRP